MQEAVKRIIEVTKAALEAEMDTTDIELSEAEIKRITGYSRPAYQIKVLRGLGIPARKRPDNSVLVLRMHCTSPATVAANDAPRRKSERR